MSPTHRSSSLRSHLYLSALTAATLVACQAGTQGSAIDVGGGDNAPDASSSAAGFDCSDVDAELTLNCSIALPCVDMSAEERTCLDDLMAMEWATPPCDLYAQCLAIPVFDCEDTEAELAQNCSIDASCPGMEWQERFCLSDLMSMDWFRPPCEEYAECLSIPLADCADIDAELSMNCEIDAPCAQMDWDERFCVSELMAIDWSQPPCPEYAACLQ